jgi:GTP-binding protein
LPPAGLPEVAFAGRSNVGKSSLINALTGRQKLAATSATPGRTRQINFFRLGGRLLLVDLPGYGYAAAPKAQIAAWTGLIDDYLSGRPTLRRVLLLIDSRHGLKEIDRVTASRLDRAAVSYQIVLTKCDKLSAAELVERRAEVLSGAERHPALHPEAIATSVETGLGLGLLRDEIARLADWRGALAAPVRG